MDMVNIQLSACDIVENNTEKSEEKNVCLPSSNKSCYICLMEYMHSIN